MESDGSAVRVWRLVMSSRRGHNRENRGAPTEKEGIEMGVRSQSHATTLREVQRVREELRRDTRTLN